MVYEVLERLGTGSRADVHRGVLTSTGAIVAIKKFRGSRSHSGVRETLEREIAALHALEGEENVVQLQAMLESGLRKVSLVFEWLPETLLDLLTRENGLPVADVRTYGRQLLRGLAAIHGKRFVHRDIKPENILIDPVSRVLKVCDLGLARGHTTDVAPWTPYVATRWYRAPEVLARRLYSYPVDVWAAGCILVEMATGDPLFPGSSEAEMVALHQRAQLLAPGVARQLGQACAEVVRICLELAPADRPTAASALRFFDARSAADLEAPSVADVSALSAGSTASKGPASSGDHDTVSAADLEPDGSRAAPEARSAADNEARSTIDSGAAGSAADLGAP
jgi:serine/threonine protein kinase